MKRKCSAFIIPYCPITGKYLMGKKEKNGKWTFFGGNIEKKESPVEAARREFFEETGIRVLLLEYVGELRNSKRIVYAYQSPISSKLKITLSKEHQKSRWFNRDLRPLHMSKPATMIFNYIDNGIFHSKAGKVIK